MNRFEELLTSVYANPARVVHLGAGSAKEYDLYKGLNANQIIFVEPDQRLTKQANEKFNGMTNVKVINYAIANEKGTQLFNIISNPRFSSLLAPTELLDFYPNITITDTVNVETITLEQLCLNDNIEDKTDNLLVAELQGLEKEVFSSTAKSTLNKFKWIVISSSEHQLYQAGSNDTQKDLTQLMRDAGYIVFCFKEDASPYTNILCVRNEATVETFQLRERVGELGRSTVVLEQQVSEQKAELTGLELENNRRISELENSLKSKSNELQIKSDQLNTRTEESNSVTDELNARTERLNLVSDDLNVRTEELNSVSDELNVRTEELKSVTDELNARTEELKSVTDELNARTEKLNSISDELVEAMILIQSISEERDKLARDVGHNKNEMAEIQQTLRINNKLMLKSEADLSDLQNQYRIAQQHQEQQHLLFCELKEKLSQASDLYRKLDLRKLMLDGDTLNQNESHEVEPLRNDDIQS